MGNKELMEKLEKIKGSIDGKIKDFLENSEELKRFIDFRKQHFYNYSIRNNILIYHQNPTASLVAGFRKWQELGYRVRKGEKAISILVPLISKKEIPEEESGKNEGYVYGYKYVNVFDIGQVEATGNAREIPDIDTRMKQNSKNKYSSTELFFKTKEIIEQYIPVDIVKDLTTKGQTDGERIILRKDTYIAMAGILVHEFTHYLNHFGEKKPSKNQMETEAELGAIIYGSYFNLDISGKYKYLAFYKEGVKLDEAFDTALSSFEQLLYGNMTKKGLIDLLEVEYGN